MHTNPSTNPRRERRLRRRRHRIRRILALAAVTALVATALLVVPAGAADDDFIAQPDEAIADIQSFWGTALPETYGRRYVPIPADRIHPYSAADPPPGCGTRGVTPYRQVAGNAFYCPDGDFIGYDVAQLVPALREEYGDVAVALVLAHEWGHAIQGRVGAPDGAFVYIELQADCFAGAWAQRVVHGIDTGLRMSEDDLDRALAGFLQLGDPQGVDGRAHGAHGNAFDRVGAFQDGLVGGAGACRDYEAEPPDFTAAAFTSYADYAARGDLPLDEVLPLLADSLDGFWAASLRAYDEAPRLRASPGARPECSGRSDGGVLSDTVVYCADSDTILYSSATLQRASHGIGDLGAGVFVAAAWASAVQADLGERLGSTRARDTSECLTGAWAAAVRQGTAASDSGFVLSPGDLDEVVGAFLATDDAQSRVDRGSVFDRVGSFRTGFAGGPDACLTV